MRSSNSIRNTNNSDYLVPPVIIELPPPADLQVDVDSIVIPDTRRLGKPSRSAGPSPITTTPSSEGEWSDAVYLSADAVWDISDKLLGRATYTTKRGLRDHRGWSRMMPLETGESYSLTVSGEIPPVEPGQYRLIVRPDIFNEIYEGLNESNNRTTSAEVFDVTVDELAS